MILVLPALSGCVWLESFFLPATPQSLVVSPVAVSQPVVNSPSLPTPPRPTALTAEAVAALNAAEAQVAAARQSRALWPSALAALENARTAAKVFDSARTVEFANEVALLCAASLDQQRRGATVTR